MKNPLKSIVYSLYMISLGFGAACAQSPGLQASMQIQQSLQAHTVVLNNERNSLPIVDMNTHFIHISIGFAAKNTLDSMLHKYANVEAVNFNLQGNMEAFVQKINPKNTVIISIGKLSAAQNMGINTLAQKLENKGNPVYIISMQDFHQLKNFETSTVPAIWADSVASDVAASNMAQILFGGAKADGKLQQNYSPKYHSGMGARTEKIRLGYHSPEYLGMDAEALKGIDVIANEGIAKRAAPGMVVLVAQHGEVIFNKAYGNYTYDKGSIPQHIDAIFDLASITKIMATTPVVMQLVAENKLNLDEKISHYLPELIGKPSETVKVKEVMLHQAGFVPFIPFYKSITAKDYSTDSSSNFPTKVAEHYYLRKNYFEEVMWPQMMNTPLKTRGKYVYSDISMYVMRAIIEKITQQKLPQLANAYYYAPLGLQSTLFNPLQHFNKDKIVPTENDEYFRKSLLQGYVHDQGAAMAGGVSGHAGLFSTSNDMAIFYQMILNKGTYGGKKYLPDSIVELFTKRNSEVSRRGLGFDRWDPDASKEYPSSLANESVFGHTGYTGTCIWVDPKNDFIYIFLSNRVNPKVSNRLSDLKIRQRIMDVIYNAIATQNSK